MKIFISSILLLIAGAILVFAFSPYNIWPFALLCPVVLAWYWRKASPRMAAWQGLCFGFGFFVFGVSWIFVSIHRFGGVPDITAGLLTALLALVLALFPAVNGYCLNRLFKNRGAIYLLAAFPASGCLFELLRSWIFTGFPWLNLGVSQVNSPLAGFAPVLSSFGCTLIALFISGLVVGLISFKMRGRFICLLLIILTFIVGYALNQVKWTIPVGKMRYVSLVQGNIPQSLKWNPNTVTLSMKSYEDQTHDSWSSDFIFWPESAIPMLHSQAEPWLNELNLEADKHGSAILLGIPMYNPNTNKYYNAATVVGRGSGNYLKRHLVPFGEYIPLAWLVGPIFKIINVPMSNFSEGPQNQPYVFMKGDKVAVFICYESAFAFEVRNHIKGAAFGAVLSDDAWFGDSIGPWQHLQIAQMRALETGRYFLNDTNTGITGIISPKGQLLKVLPADTRSTLHGKIQAMRGETPWVHYGAWPLSLILLILLLIGFSFGRKNK